ncbi:MAG TPA: HAMP domain-containing histidine kinase [Arcobacter sp.]|nr:HAMP domain-containing histidine kinase [Arcobacter sp.]
MKFNSLKTRVLLWFGIISFVVLLFFTLSFHFFLDTSIKYNIQTRLEFIAHKYKDYLTSNTVGIAVIENGKVKFKNSNFSLSNFQEYAQQDENFFIFEQSHDDDYIDALYIDIVNGEQIMVYQKNIDNKIENFEDVLFFLIPILLIIFIILASKMLNKILLPINNLNDAISDVSITKFTKTIEIPKENDEIKKLIISFNKMIERLHEGVERLDRFNTDVSHELKTPLTVIQGEAELALRKMREPIEYQKTLSIIQGQSKQIQLIVQQLLLLTKYTRDNIKESFETCLLDSILIATIDKFQGQLHEKNITLDIQKIEPITMHANPVLIESIFSNIIDNAIKYTPNDKKISLWLYQDTQTHFIVKDEGVGIEKHHLSKITERFYRVDSSRNKKINGFGLGLSIVKNSVNMHNGSINLDSSSMGTRVEILFP